MKKTLLTLLAVILMTVPAMAADGQIQLQWTAPVTNSDGSALDDLEGFNIYYQNAPGIDKTKAQKITVQKDQTGTVISLPAGNWCFAGTAFDEVPNESVLTNEVCAVVTDEMAPATYTITIVGN